MIISDEVSGVLSVEPDNINNYAVKVCRAAGSLNTDINIVFIGDEKMTGLNETYKRRSGTTDVLSFDLSDTPSPVPGFNRGITGGLPGDNPGHFIEGEVYVSLDRAKIQAKEFSSGNIFPGKDLSPFEKEVVRLVTHGLLHLNGRTHDTPESYRAMVDETERMIAMYWEGTFCD